MRKRYMGVMIAVLLLLFTGCTREAYVEDHTLKSTVSALASDEFKGRLAGTEGNKKAQEYIADRFEKIGLEALNDTGYFQEYTQTVYNPDNQEYTFVINYNDGSSKECVSGKDYLVQLNTSSFHITCPITYDSLDRNLNEKIVVIDKTDSIKEVMNNARAILIKREEFFKSAHASSSYTPIITISGKLYEELKNNSISSIEIKADYKEEEVRTSNVVGRIKGSNNKKALVISAHFDHVGWEGINIFNGAVDNASGTAVMLDVAERLVKSSVEKQLSMDILICAFNGEEEMCKGSTAFVDMIKNRYDYIYNINIDCVGKKDGGRIALDNTSGIDTELLAGIKESLEENKLEYVDKYYGMSDHQSFINNGLCGITIGQEDLSNGSRIHSPKDTLDNIDADYLKRVSDAVYGFIMNNNGREYKLSGKGHAGNEMQEISEETWKKVEDKAKELKKEKQLKYDEVIAFEVDGYICQVSGSRALRELSEINRYYPDMLIPEKLMGYSFDSINIRDGYSGTSIYNDVSDYKNEVGKIYKRELDSRNIRFVTINYINKDQKMIISIQKQSSINNEPYFKLEFCDTEEVEINTNKYIILKNKKQAFIEGIYREYTVNGRRYRAELRKNMIEEKGNNAKSDTEQNENARKEIIAAAEQIDMEEIIKGLGI